MKYESIVYLTGWQEHWRTHLTLLKELHSQNGCLFVEVQTWDIQDAMELAQTLLPVNSSKRPYIFKLWHRQNLKKNPKTTKKGPKGCILSDTIQVWCFPFGAVEYLKPCSSEHIHSPRQIDVLDEIADHLTFNKRVLVSFDSTFTTPSTEFHVFIPSLNKTIEQKNFCLSSARKSRMFKAYLEQKNPQQLVRDKRVLVDYLDGKDIPQDEDIPQILTILPERHTEEFDVLKCSIIPMLQRVLTRKRKQLQNADGTPPAKRKNVQKSGIAANCNISGPLRHFLIHECGMVIESDGVARTEVVRAIPKYIKSKELNTGKIVHPNEAMKSLLPKDFDPATELTFFNIYKHINHHFAK